MMKSKGIVIGTCIADVILLIICIFLYLRMDRTAPIIHFGENNITYTEGMDTVLLLEGVTAVDDEDGDVTDTLLIEKISDTAKGDVLVTYVALDQSDNVAKAGRIFPVKINANRQEESQLSEVETVAGDPSETGAETQTQTSSESEETADNDRQDENDNPEDQMLQDEGQNNENGHNDAGADVSPANEAGDNEAPILQLSKEVLTVKAGAESVNWNECIRKLSDDKDNREQLFSNFIMEGQVDLGTPGEYPVVIYTRDSEGIESERRNVVVRVER